MKKYIGILAAVFGLLISGEARAQGVRDQDIDVPGLSTEIEALTGGGAGRPSGEEGRTSELYRLLRKDAALSAYGELALEKSYDPRKSGKVTPARLQRSNTCWAFSTLAAAEQSLVAKGLADPEKIDLSEAHLTYFFYHSVEDPLGNTAGDGNHNISNVDFMEAGSNTIFSTFALAGWVGAAKEEAAPFESLTAQTSYEKDLAYSGEAHLQNAYWINFSDVDASRVVKQMIRKFGAAAVNLYFHDDYFDAKSGAYYFPLDSGQADNHSAAIVGWDDDYPRENFREGCRPKEDGAWIVKNSYGPSWGEEGYFYLSYEDGSVHSGNDAANRARAYVFDFEPADNYDYNYQYDGSAGAYNATSQGSSLTKVASKGRIANVFQARSGTKGETLRAAAFALFDTAVSYQVQIYKNPTDPADPASGTPQLSEPASGSTSYAGYYTVPLPEPVAINEGDVFSVVVTLEKESGGQIDFFADKSYQNGDWISFTNEVEKGQSFRFVNGEWEDMAKNGITARVKAFSTAEARAPAERLLLAGMQPEEDGRYAARLWTDETLALKPVVYPASASQVLQWETSDPSVVSVDSDGTLRPIAAGAAVVTGKTTDGSGLLAECRVTVLRRAKGIRLNASVLRLYVGESASLDLLPEPADASMEEIVWQSAGEAASVDDSGVVWARRPGESDVAAYLKSDPGVWAGCKVIVEEKRQGRSEGEAAEPTGKSSAVAVKSAETSDLSGRLERFWLAMLLAGGLLMFLGIRRMRR